MIMFTKRKLETTLKNKWSINEAHLSHFLTYLIILSEVVLNETNFYDFLYILGYFLWGDPKWRKFFSFFKF